MRELLRHNKRPLIYAVGLHAILLLLVFVSFDWLDPKPSGSSVMQAEVVNQPPQTKQAREQQKKLEQELERQAEAQRKLTEAEQKKKETDAKKKTQEEAKQKAIQEAKRKQEEEEQRKLAADEAKRKKQEEECKKQRARLEKGELKLEQLSKGCLTPDDVEKIQEAEQDKREAEDEAKQEAEEETKKKAEAEAKLKAEEEAKRKTEEDAKRKVDAEAARKKTELDAQERRRREEEAFERAGLDRMRADEERSRTQAEMGPAINAYIIKLNGHVTPNWIRPPTGPDRFKCLLYVRQRQDGTIVDVRIKASCGSPALDDSVLRAMRKSSPLPLPDDLRVFDEELEFVFEPRS